MTKKTVSHSTGSVILQILIAFFIIVLLLAIHVPKKLWEQQVKNVQICLERMENLYFASHFFHRKTGSYISDIAELMVFAERESLTVYPASFKLDRLTREDSGIDSFLIDYFDPYQLFSHFKEVTDTFYPAGRDSLVLSIAPSPQYKFLPVTKYTFAADSPISVQVDDRGDQGKFLLVGTQGQLRRQHLIGETIQVKASDYIYNIDKEKIDRCPSTKTPYVMNVNVKIAIQAEMDGTLEKEPIDTSLASSKLLSSLVVFRWLKEADALAKAELVREKTFETVEDSLIQELNSIFLDSIAADLRARGEEQLAVVIYDSTLVENTFEDSANAARWEEIRDASYSYQNGLKDNIGFQKKRDNIVNERKDLLAAKQLQTKLETLHQKRSILITESGIINTIADSIDFYSNPDLIKDRLLKAHLDSITLTYLERSEISELLSRFSYTESYRVGRVDSVGISIDCPIEDTFAKADKSFLEKIFTVKGEKKHGNVKNGDLSWSERR